MGITASHSEPLQRPKDIIKLNDSVYELCTPEGVPDVELVFFHGLQLSSYEEAFWTTWMSRDKTVVWPKDWLNGSLGSVGIQARILSISYDSSAQHHAGEPDLYIIIENLIQDMIDNARIGQNCPVILVGHSLGGIIIKQLLVESVTKRYKSTSQGEVARLGNFLDNCKGLFYYSTPHAGSRIADYAARIPLRRFNDVLMNLLKTLGKETARINHEFALSKPSVGEGKLRTWAIGESTETTYMHLTAKVVEEASARHDVDHFYTAKRADHFEVCRPTDNTTDASFVNLVSLVNDVLESERIAAKRLDLHEEHNQ